MNRAALAALLADPAVARALAVLDGAGEETRIVGGAVRNALIGLPTTDIDLATTATPDIVMRRAKDAGLRRIPTGFEHGTVTVVVAGRPFEVTSLREDVETDGRRAKVRFGRDFGEDARRRDFTINSMSLTRDGVLHDPLGGEADLAARRVRFIGDADRRIAEDYLRVLRFFRFSAAYGEGPLDRDGLAAAIRGRAGLERLSAERVRAETLKLLAARRGPEVAREAAQAGLLDFALAGVALPARLERAAAIEAARGLPADPVLRLCAFAVLVREDADRLRDRLRLSNAERRRLHDAAHALEALHGRTIPPQGTELAELVFLHGADAVGDALALAHAEAGAPPDDADWRAAYAAAEDLRELKLPVTGDDLKQRGVTEGRAIGAMLKTLQAKWIRAGFPRDPAEIARLIDEAIALREI
ncbi:MAG TPA: CCA tRNA nucleotidyltransferase [Rhodoblastus sp.]|nr:CCA tRNA nucleotidyltransferase [Rhodoblastus sp.]